LVRFIKKYKIKKLFNINRRHQENEGD